MTTATLTANQISPPVVDSRDDLIALDCNRKRGGQPGNGNGLRHGLHSARADRWCSAYGNQNVNKFRRAMESEVVEEYGKISVYAAALIQTATEATRAAIANREILAGLLDKGGDLKTETRLALDREYIAHLDRRDKKLQELGLTVDDLGHGSGQRRADPFAALALAGVATEIPEPLAAPVAAPVAPQPHDSPDGQTQTQPDGSASGPPGASSGPLEAG